jgi:hypothetical protein
MTDAPPPSADPEDRSPQGGNGDRPVRSGFGALGVLTAVVCVPALLGGIAVALALGPLRDSDAVTSILDGVTRDDAKGLCVSWVRERWQGPEPRLRDVRAVLVRSPTRWQVSGRLSTRDTAGPFTCTIGWSAGGGAVYLDEIGLPNGYVGGIDEERPESG